MRGVTKQQQHPHHLDYDLPHPYLAYRIDKRPAYFHMYDRQECTSVIRDESIDKIDLFCKCPVIILSCVTNCQIGIDW